MSKKLGIGLMFIGAYVSLLGGLFWVMHFTGEDADLVKVYDWVWGVLVAAVVCIGAALAAKKNVLGLVGCSIGIAGGLGNFGVLAYGSVVEKFVSPWFIVGAVLSLLGGVIALVFHIIDTIHFKKYGPTLL